VCEDAEKQAFRPAGGTGKETWSNTTSFKRLNLGRDCQALSGSDPLGTMPTRLGKSGLPVGPGTSTPKADIFTCLHAGLEGRLHPSTQGLLIWAGGRLPLSIRMAMSSYF
jgi:hypothetical protein